MSPGYHGSGMLPLFRKSFNYQKCARARSLCSCVAEGDYYMSHVHERGRHYRGKCFKFYDDLRSVNYAI
ncbi:hypothetical protein HD806DRAFT_494474 [Xylariaceae sp. AK1471]|nr:hypothetical protein HD806DRAFT_494474 [Xylariaceae sp. AK1471]